MKDKITKKVTTDINKTKRVLRNLERLIEAVALLSLGAFTAYVVISSQVNVIEQVKYVLLVSSAVVFIRGAYEFVKFLDRE